MEERYRGDQQMRRSQKSKVLGSTGEVKEENEGQHFKKKTFIRFTFESRRIGVQDKSCAQ